MWLPLFYKSYSKNYSKRLERNHANYYEICTNCFPLLCTTIVLVHLADANVRSRREDPSSIRVLSSRAEGLHLRDPPRRRPKNKCCGPHWRWLAFPGARP